MQRPTCLNTRITTTEDAHRLFHAAGYLGLPEVPMVYRRLDADERRYVRSGSVFVWEERSTSSEAAGLGIERWTDGLRWGPSRVRDFLFYQEKFSKAEGSNVLTKQTYSAWVELPNGVKKWHLTAYFTTKSMNDLGSLDDIPCMRGVKVPEGMYRRSRTGKRKADIERRLEDVMDRHHSPPSPLCGPGSPPHGRFALYPPFASPVPSSPASLSNSSSESMEGHEEDFYPWKRPCMRSTYHFSGEKQKTATSTGLAPLSYLQSLHHPRRNPADEVVLRAFASFN